MNGRRAGAQTHLKGNAMTMQHRSSTTIRTALFLALLLAAGAAAAQAQPQKSGASAIKRTPVYTGDVTPANHEAVVVKAELAGNSHAGRHTHPGDEISYVVDGEGELLVDGQPPRKLKAGEGFVVKEGQVHDLRNNSGTPVHLIGVYVVEKGKPLATPVK
jgi:quercetin dioxygenase-like cupin family protein